MKLLTMVENHEEKLDYNSLLSFKFMQFSYIFFNISIQEKFTKCFMIFHRTCIMTVKHHTNVKLILYYEFDIINLKVT